MSTAKRGGGSRFLCPLRPLLRPRAVCVTLHSNHAYLGVSFTHQIVRAFKIETTLDSVWHMKVLNECLQIN